LVIYIKKYEFLFIALIFKFFMLFYLIKILKEREIRVVKLEYEGKLFYLENHIKLLTKEISMWKDRNETIQKELDRNIAAA
jgi:hypothetical protein